MDAENLADQIARVCAVGLGRPLRSNAVVDELVAVSKALATDKTLTKLRLIEEALKISIERLGEGELGQLARMEFGLHPRTERERFLKGRRYVAKQKLGLGDEGLARLERYMCLALAEDLIKRLEDKDVSLMA